MPISLALIVALILTLGATIYLCIAVLPAHRDGDLPRPLQGLHNLFRFKKLYLEVILRFFYLLSTCFCVFFGFFLIFSRTSFYSYSHFFGETYYQSYALQGLLLLLLGPIALRIGYELLMLLILAVKNLMEINHKLSPSATPQSPPDAAEEPSMPPSSLRYVYCTQCGTRYLELAGKCPSCGLE